MQTLSAANTESTRRPIAAKPRDSGTRNPTPPRWFALSAFFATVALTGVAFAWSIFHESDTIVEDLAHRGPSLAASIQREISRRGALLEALASFVLVTRGDNRADLRVFIGGLARDPGTAVSLDWIPRIKAEALRAYEEKQWLQGSPDFRVHRSADPLPPAAEYLPLHFGIGAGARIEGLDLTPGADLSTAGDLAATLATARARRATVVTNPMQLVRPDGTRPAVLLATPVFAPPSPAPKESGDLDNDFLGFALGIFELDSLVRGVLSDSDRTGIDLELRDSVPDASAPPFFFLHAPRSEPDHVLSQLWNVVGREDPPPPVAFDVAGRRWSLGIAAGPRLIVSHLTWLPWIITTVGLLLSFAVTTVANSYATRGGVLASARKRLASERRDYMEKVSHITDDLDREKLDRRRTEESLFREKQQFRLMFNAVPAMICYKDTKNRFLLVNEAAAASMGRKVEEMEGKPCSEIIPAKAYELYRDDLEIIQTGKPKLGLIEESQLPEGRTVWTRTDKLPEYDAMGRVVGILVFSQDISQHREAEAEVRRLNEELEHRVSMRTAELRTANQELESFAYSVSHDLRTPLRTIDGFSRLVLEEHGDALPPTAHEYLQRLCSAAQRMGHLIDDLLKLTRVSRAELKREEVDLSALARQTVEDLRRAHPERRVDVVIEATPLAVGDPALLANVMQNLLGNAWKFTGKTAEPRIEFGSKTTSGDRTAFYIRDNGVGFDMVYADKLFGAFQRLHRHEEFEGSGIGLATVQLIIRRHGGEVRAESVPDQGTTFYFSLGS